MSTAHQLGLRPGQALNHTPAFLAFHFIFAYGVLSSRTLKQYYGIDDNVAPRYNLRDYGEQAVKAGKITRRQLGMLKRCESASANAVENYTLLVGALCIVNIAGVERERINAAGLVYTIARVAYGVIYVLVDHRLWSQLRGVTWWTGNISCFYLLWQASGKLNAQ